MISHEHLGLFDTPPNAKQTRFALAIVGVMSAAFLAVLPVCSDWVGESGAFIPSISTGMFVAELIIASLLYAQAAVFRSRALTVLASGYVLTAILLIPYALTFPGAFAPNGLLGAGLSTTTWLMIFRRLAFPLSVILYVILKWRDEARPPEAERPPQQVLLWISGAFLLAIAGTLLATLGHHLLPPMFINRSDRHLVNLTIFNLGSVALVSVAMAMLFQRRKSVLDVW